MPEATAPTPPPLPVVVLHEAAEVLAAGIVADDAIAERIAEFQAVLGAALATRAASTAEVGYRLALLRTTLVHEASSDFAVALLDALAMDMAAITTGAICAGAETKTATPPPPSCRPALRSPTSGTPVAGHLSRRN